ncbi:metallophosphoesterase [Streptomyces sp. XM4193]|uniref:metallophosphoesterase family protein n=1 Tax=Streptomyces sp. XM4193 TaxID=2929782 RepID=UPI001FF709EB|nr:metallophosphoesterase [Streptomyces sp. XM4193]MCK1797132.1 metallophosphoesterase [Streptomyces sp. XM4193]
MPTTPYEVRGTVEPTGAAEPGAAPEPGAQGRAAKLVAIADLHIRYQENREITEAIQPESPEDWLVIAGDIGETVADIEWTLRIMTERFARVVWVPGNHELWTAPGDPVQLRGEAKYRHLVELARSLGVVTPEDPFPVFEGIGGPVVVAPLFLLYDYSFRMPGVATKEEALRRATKAGVVCTDEHLLHPDPYPTLDAWCRARLEYSEKRLVELSGDLPTVLINHWPVVREPTDVLWYPEFALWCGTEATADWPTRFRAATVVYGHLHIPRLMRIDGVPHQEVSLGYPREWRRHGRAPGRPVQILPPPIAG